MASSVVSDNFETGTGGVPQLGGTGATTCKAWVNFNGNNTVAIRDSYNVSSLVDNGTGDYTVNFTTAMNNTNYGIGSTAGDTSSQGERSRRITSHTTATTYIRVNSSYSLDTLTDVALLSVQIFSN